MDDIRSLQLPRHVAIIMDGNGRWAKERMLQRIVGHQRGVETVRMIVEEASSLGLGYLTLYAFSSENWSRPRTEITALMSMLKRYIANETPRMMTNDIRFNVIGDREMLPDGVNRSLDKALQVTAVNRGMILTLALSYGSRQEIARAARMAAVDILKGRFAAEELDESRLAGYLFTSDMPDPDLLIRTSGEMRLSNFLLWQMAYSELYFCPLHWPDFSRDELHRALRAYHGRERRFGKTSEQIR
jgi:undecaprenyl diphosphate synthase